MILFIYFEFARKHKTWNIYDVKITNIRQRKVNHTIAFVLKIIPQANLVKQKFAKNVY